ncbi:MAG: hypothetical protein LIO91_08845 [Bacteroidales bacterium]|nr:hypothetical protein [Bacteroidales bacterium]
MKSPGAISDFARDRDSDILDTCRRVMASVSHIRIADIAADVASSPARRFYVSEERATAVVCSLLKGRDALARMVPLRQEMFAEIFARYNALRSLHPRLSIARLVSMVIHQPAPKFYLAPSSIYTYLFRIKKQKRNETRRQRLNP